MSLMKVEKVPDSTYDMVGGLDQQIKEIKEVRTHRLAFTSPLAAASFPSPGLSLLSVGRSFASSHVTDAWLVAWLVAVGSRVWVSMLIPWALGRCNMATPNQQGGMAV